MCLGRQNATSLESTSGEYQKTRSSAGSEKRIWRYWLLELQNNMLSWQHLFLVLITHWFHNRFLSWVMRFLPRCIFHTTQKYFAESPFLLLSFLKPVKVEIKRNPPNHKHFSKFLLLNRSILTLVKIWHNFATRWSIT